MKQAYLKIIVVLSLVLPAAPAYAIHTGAGDARWGVVGIFPREQLFCGRNSWKFPGLIWGERPLGVCILRGTMRENRFGGPFGF